MTNKSKTHKNLKNWEINLNWNGKKEYNGTGSHYEDYLSDYLISYDLGSSVLDNYSTITVGPNSWLHSATTSWNKTNDLKDSDYDKYKDISNATASVATLKNGEKVRFTSEEAWWDNVWGHGNIETKLEIWFTGEWLNIGIYISEDSRGGQNNLEGAWNISSLTFS